MSVSEKIGSLPWLSFAWDHGPIAAFLIALLADYGIICLFMFLEGLAPEGLHPWQRTLYRTFAWNDTVFIPAYVAMAVVVLKDAPPASAFYTTDAWHVAVLLAGFATSIVMEVSAVKNGQYTISQELSPSKVWHTFIFGVVFYWLVSSLTPVAVEIFHTRPVWPTIVIAICITGFFWMTHLDMTNPWPPTAHLEGSWLRWDWRPRIY